jgi:replicative DNA helicase Mcm
MEKEDVSEKFVEFLNEYYKGELSAAITEGKKSITIDFSLLDKFDIELADYLLENPEEVIATAEDALKQIDTGLAETKLRLRFTNLPESREIRIRNVRAEHIGKMIVIDGIVKRASEIRPEVSEAVFQCPECGNRISIIQTERIIRTPLQCDSCDNRKGFRLVDQKLYDARWIVVEEPFEITTGERPSELTIYLKEDLTSPKMQNKTDPGNRIKVVGVLKELPRRVKGTRSRQMEIYLDANHVESVETVWEELEITEEDEKKIIELAKDPEVFNKLIASIAPSMYGMDEVKEAIILQLFSAEPKILKDKTRIRGNIHILLIGDPASGKSQIMQLASRLIPRGKYVSGSGVTAAGITATVVRDEEFLGGWVLEAGALVMSNKSICCLHPSSNVIVSNEIIPISKLFDEAKLEKVICNQKLMDVCKLTGAVPSFDLGNLRMSEQTATLVRRKKYHGKILSMKFESGFEIKLTPEHLLIDGDTLTWKKAKDFKECEFVLAPLKLPSKKDKILIFDLIPDEWKVCLDKKEKEKIKKLILRKYKSIAEFNRKLSLRKEIFCGGCQPSLKQFKDVIKDIGVTEWVKKTLKYGRRRGGIRLKITEVTPELGYILGFILGDGYLSRGDRHSGMRVTQSIKHKKFIEKFINNWNKVFSKELHEYEDNREDKIHGRKVKSTSKILYCGSSLLALLYDKLIGKSLEKILSLPDEILKSFIAGVFDSDGCISIKRSKKKNREYRVAHVEFLISKDPQINLNFMLGLRRLDTYSKLITTGKNVDIIRITGRKDVLSLKNSICNYSVKIKNVEIPERVHEVSSRSNKLPKFLVAEICREILNEVNTSLLNKTELKMIYPYKNLNYQPSRDELEKTLKKIGGKLSHGIREKIESLLQRDFFLDRIVKIKFEDYDGFVFDLFVPETNNFVANGIFVHNCIDEFSKVAPQDRVALQEAMSMETISIAKASIVATLPAQTAILAGGNPKLGRFDPYLPIREQIDIDDVLLSRFDLKFALRDVPNPDIDSKVAEHILRMRKFEEEAKPIIEPEFLRKYIAYARTHVRPQITEEVGKKLMEFYLEMRTRAGEEAPVSITLRQYESLLRLAEASARVRLSPTIDVEDAERAIRLMKISLRQFGFEPETGKLDIDRAEGARVTAVQRSKIRIMLDVIEELGKVFGKEIPVDDVVRRAKEEGVENPEDILRKMESEGMLYRPRPNVIAKT